MLCRAVLCYASVECGNRVESRKGVVELVVWAMCGFGSAGCIELWFFGNSPSVLEVENPPELRNSVVCLAASMGAVG
jgi:hypothetical protein